MINVANTKMAPAKGLGNLFSKILIPLIDPVHARPYLNFASALLSQQGKILGLKVLEIPEGESLSAGAERAPLYRATMEELNSQLEEDRKSVV